MLQPRHAGREVGRSAAADLPLLLLQVQRAQHQACDDCTAGGKEHGSTRGEASCKRSNKQRSRQCFRHLLNASSQVTTEHVLLGLIAEDTSSKHGFMNSGLTVEKARAAVETLSGRRKPISTHDNIPFSREVRKTFEAATNVSEHWQGLSVHALACCSLLSSAVCRHCSCCCCCWPQLLLLLLIAGVQALSSVIHLA